MREAAPGLPGVVGCTVHGWQGGQLVQRPDWLAQETPVALVFNGISHAVMMASPSDLEDFALGFALSEGLVERVSEVYGIEVREVAEGIELQLRVSAACEWRLKARRRTLSGKTGCGLCGTESLAQVRRPLACAVPPAPDTPPPSVSPEAVARAMGALREQQAMQALSGATHAAASCARDGRIDLLREDVGRHNALDKLVGALAKAPAGPAPAFIAITSRASFEMVQKTLAAGVPALVAVSAPTALAVSTAQQGRLALAGFARGQDFVAYTHPERWGLAPHAHRVPA